MYIPLFVHSHYSILEGLNNPKEIVAAAKNNNLPAIALTDINNCSGAIEFYKEAKKAKIKPIIGSLLSTDEGSLLLIASNHTGYIELIQILAELNSKNHYTIPLSKLNEFNLNDIICITGHEGSTLYNTISFKYSFKETWQELAQNHLNNLKSLFKTLYIELQYSETDVFSKELQQKYIDLSIQSNIELIACPRVHYLDKSEQELHQILVATKQKSSLIEVNQINNPTYKFFHGYRFYLPTSQEFIQEINNTNAINNTINLTNKVQDYEIERLPSLPKFKCPNKKTSEEYIRDLCRQGWNKKINQEDSKTYQERLDMELEVFKNANLFDYFLIIKDILDYTRAQGYLVGIGRGSSAGCLVSYLLDITQLDPIKHNLIFERFFNQGRANSYPDIDCDFEARSRDKIIDYITKKYGKQNVSQISTYGTLMGRAALKAVFRAYNDTAFSEQNEITKIIPDKAKISDELQQMGDEASVIKWSLLNKKKYLENWCVIKDNKLEGPLADKFNKAIRLEGVIATQSIHAAGVVIGPKPLKTLIPIINNKNNKPIIGCQMNDLEYAGLLKLDILSVAVLDRLKDINLDI